MKSAPKKPTKKKIKPPPKYVYVNATNSHYMSVRQCVEEMGYHLTESDTKHMLLWCDAAGSIDTASTLEPWQFYNHFPGIWSIAHKVDLARNLDRMSRLMPSIYTYHPKTFLLPGQYFEMKSYMNSIPKKTDRTFIIKPDRGSQGKGIILIQDAETIEDYSESAVAQSYIPPFLIESYKFDLRIYVLCTSVDPLRLYIFKEGMARFCTMPYVPPKPNNLDQVFSHLTNYSLNKKNEDFVQPEDAENAETGSKRSLSFVLKEIQKQGYSVQETLDSIDNIIRLTFASVQPFLANNYRTAINVMDGKSRCFEIYGFDILLDSNCHPWLLEVNCMPSLTCDSPFDTSLKFSVIKGTLKIIELYPGFKKAVLARQKAITQKRISGTTTLPTTPLFDPKHESDIAKSTQWRQIWPIDDEPRIQKYINAMNEALDEAKASPLGAAVETAASRARKEAVKAQMLELKQKQIEEKTIKKIPKYLPAKLNPDKPKIKIPKPTTSNSNSNPASSLHLNPTMNPKTGTSNSKLRDQILNDTRLILSFSSVQPQYINDGEEKARIRAIRHQMLIAQSVNLQQRIKIALGDNNLVPPYDDPSKGVDKDKDKEKEKEKDKKASKQLVKPVVYYRQVLIADH